MSAEILNAPAFSWDDLYDTNRLNMLVRSMFARRGMAGLPPPTSTSVEDAMDKLGIEHPSGDNVSIFTGKVLEKHNASLFWVRRSDHFVLGVGILAIGAVAAGLLALGMNLVSLASDELITIVVGRVGVFLVALGYVGVLTIRTIERQLWQQVIIEEVELAEIDDLFAVTDDFRRNMVRMKYMLPETQIRVRQAYLRKKPLAMTVETLTSDRDWRPLLVVGDLWEETYKLKK